MRNTTNGELPQSPMHCLSLSNRNLVHHPLSVTPPHSTSQLLIVMVRAMFEKGGTDNLNNPQRLSELVFDHIRLCHVSSTLLSILYVTKNAVCVIVAIHFYRFALYSNKPQSRFFMWTLSGIIPSLTNSQRLHISYTSWHEHASNSWQCTWLIWHRCPLYHKIIIQQHDG